MIGKRLTALRKQKGVSQRELGDAIGVSHYTVSAYEIGRSEPDDDIKVRLAEYFDVSVDFLLGLIDEPASYNRNTLIVTVPRGVDRSKFAACLDKALTEAQDPRPTARNFVE